MEEIEIWKAIEGYEGLYEVSNFGRVKSLNKYIKNKYGSFSLRKEKFLSINYHKTKNKKRVNCHVSLTKDYITKTYLVARLVGFAFVDNTENKPEINHKDGNTLNNYVNNLEWTTSSENQLHAFRIGLQKSRKGEDNNFSKLTKKEVIEIKNKYIPRLYTQDRLAKEYNVKRNTISYIVNNINWKDV